MKEIEAQVKSKDQKRGFCLINSSTMTIDESWMREICTSSLTRGRDIARQARYAVFRHRRGNPETRSTETYPYRCTLSTLPADGTLALEASAGSAKSGDGQTLGTGVVLGEPGCA